MPHIKIKCFPGRTENQKTLCAEKIAEIVAETLNCDVSSVSVAFEEISREDWKEKVWDTEIMPNMNSLYKKPGYTYK